MRPGQTTVNELKAEVLRRLSDETPALKPVIDLLHVLSREFTGVGCYTRFAPLKSPVEELGDRTLSLPGVIEIPEVEYGPQVVLVCKDGSPDYFEFCSIGRWDGTFDGFWFSEGD